MTKRRRKRDPQAEYWDPHPEELAEVGYLEDGIIWLTVTPETATPEQALDKFSEGDPEYQRWRVRGQWHLAVDPEKSRRHNQTEMQFTDASDPDGHAFWEIAAPDYDGPEGEWPEPETDGGD